MSNSKEEWRKNSLDLATARFTQRQENFQTDSGIEINPVYTAEDLSERKLDYVNDIGFPAPFVVSGGMAPAMHAAGTHEP